VNRTIRIFTRIVKSIDDKFRLPGGGQAEAYIGRGLDLLEKSFPLGMSDNRIADYIVYQLYRYADNIAGVAATHFQYTWCFSENAVKKFHNQYFGAGNPKIDYYIDKWLKDLGFDRDEVTAFITGPKPNKWRKYIEMPSEEMIKRRFHNTKNGLMLCSSSTMGWSPGSRACQECNYTKECKMTTGHRYPELLRLRTEEDGNNKKESTDD